MADDRHPEVDPTRPRGGAFDKPDLYSGEDYSAAREQEEGAKMPSGEEDTVASGGDPAHPGGRAHFDAKTGAVSQAGLKEDE